MSSPRSNGSPDRQTSWFAQTPSQSQQPEKIKLWVLMFGGVAFIVLLYASWILFFKPARQGGTNDGNRRPIQPTRELRQLPSLPDNTGDLATRSNSANRDTDLPIEVKATLNGTLQRPQ